MACVPERWMASDLAVRRCRVSGRQPPSIGRPRSACILRRFGSRSASSVGACSMNVDLATRVMQAGASAAAAAAQSLAEGGLVAFPTETVYGLGADACNAKAVARLFAAKGRPRFNPLISHVADPALARRLARFDPAAERLVAAFWPGPLTLVLPK